MTVERQTTVGPNQVMRIERFAPLALCQTWLDQVLANREVWETRFDYIHSYGSAWYLDIETGLLAYYHANAESTNALLEELTDLVPRLAASSQYLVAPGGQTNLPARPRAENLGPYWANAGVVMMSSGHEGVVHPDYEGLSPYPPMLFDLNTRAYSVVLPLAAPSSGGDLKIWPQRYLASEHPNLENVRSQIVEYTVGDLVLFDSFCYHQIQASRLDDEHPFRAIAAMHFLYLEKPYPHWEHWF